MHPVDHLILAAPALDVGIADLERRLGVTASPGGRHPRWGTRNALIALGPGSDLEVRAPDPDAPAPARPRPFALDTLEAPRLAGWAARAGDLERVAEAARTLGLDLGAIEAGARIRPDGGTLTWRITDPCAVRPDGIVPFFIDWGSTPHPAESAPAGCALAGFRIEHPDAERLAAVFRALELDAEVARGPAVALVATIRSARGVVEIRSRG